MTSQNEYTNNNPNNPTRQIFNPIFFSIFKWESAWILLGGGTAQPLSTFCCDQVNCSIQRHKWKSYCSYTQLQRGNVYRATDIIGTTMHYWVDLFFSDVELVVNWTWNFAMSRLVITLHYTTQSCFHSFIRITHFVWSSSYFEISIPPCARTLATPRAQFSNEPTVQCGTALCALIGPCINSNFQPSLAFL